MIAFIRLPEESTGSPRLQHVRHLLAATLLPQSERSNSALPVAAWKAWLFAGWLTIVALWSISYAVGTLL